MIGAPCNKCEKSGCGLFHNQCEKYLAYLEEIKMIKEKKLQEKSYLGYVIDKRTKAIKKNARRD